MDPICRIKEVYKTLHQFENTFAERHGITINEAMLLCCLKNGEVKTAGELCEYIGLSGPRVSKIITTVENKGYIRRGISSHDRLTEEGVAKIRQMQTAPVGLEELFAQLKNSMEEQE